MGNKPNSCLVLDVGKTNVKIHVLDERLKSLASFVRANEAICSDPYPHADVDGIWQWMMETFQKCAARFDIHAIAVSTHGATAALVDSSASGNSLVLPVMDYEWSGVDSINESYAPLRPAFGETGSPELAAGLNLGRQLMWQQHQYPGEFARADALLMYPQYWTWRLCGVPVSEVSSLGCHTDLWAPGAGNSPAWLHARDGNNCFPHWHPHGQSPEPSPSRCRLQPDYPPHAAFT
jgi:sugar (pentulose or hexulose) kinase